MPQVVNHGGRDAWVLSSHPNDNHGGTPYMRIAADTHYALERLQFTVPRGATVTSAYLELHARGDVPAQTITARRLSDSFNERHVTWNKMPGVTGTSASVTVGALSDGDLIRLDVTKHAQTIASGAKNYGWRISTDSATVSRFYGLDAGRFQPRLVLQYADKPGVPTDIVPSGGAVVADPVPTITFNYMDVTGEGMRAVQVQCDPAGNESAPAFDSGTVSTTEAELDLSTTAFAPLAAGASTKRRVRTQGNDGAWSDWSKWETFTYQPQVAVTLNSPSTATPFAYEPTPEILFQTDKPLSAYQVRITRGDDRTHVLYNSHRVPANGATTIGHTIPKRWRDNRVLRDDRTYAVNVRAWDQTEDREATPGSPTFGYTWLDFTMDDDAGVAPVASLTAEQDGITPWVILTWTRSTAPDSFLVRMDGSTVESGIDPADVLVSGSTYQWRYSGASPLESHDFHVKAVVNKRQSPPGPVATVKTKPEGLWLIDYDRDLSFVLSDTGVENWRMVDQVGLYRRMNGRQLQIHTGMGGLEGSFEGTMGYNRADGRTVKQLQKDLHNIKERPDATLQLIAGQYSIPVKVRNLYDAPAEDTFAEAPRCRVSFEFFQHGDLPFDVRL